MSWLAICDVCGFEYYSDQLKKRWDGLMVCRKDFELRHPQDFLKTPREETSLPWTRPEPADVFITVDYLDTGNNHIPLGHFERIQAIAGVAVAGISIAGDS